MTVRWDAVVAGGGFAGLAAATAAASRGMRVLVLERKRAARDSVHTTGLLCPDTLGILAPPPRLVGPRLDAFVLATARGGVRVERWGAGFTATDTCGVLRELEDRAVAAGAEIRHGRAMQGVEERAGGAVAVAGAERIACEWVVGADGTRSAVALSLGLPRPSRLLVGCERHVEVGPATGELDPGAMTVVLHRAWAPGYFAYAFRGTGGAWQVGVLGLVGHGYRPALAVDEFRRWLFRRHGFGPGRVVETRAGVVPVGGASSRVHSRRAVLVGDAAGHVSALTAGGIGRASHVGEWIGLTLEQGPTGWREALEWGRRGAGRHRSALRRIFELTRLPGVADAMMSAASLPPAGALLEELLFRLHPARPRHAAAAPARLA